ncbi:MAG: 4Fe-4S binding protein [candidate division NC10 bacterium]|nr:4Fe-4S binding protein [candidate division NC10 bacterium]
MGKSGRSHTGLAVLDSPPRLLAVITESCTGCEVCLDFCPVDCIEPSPPPPAPRAPAPVHIREEECIGCRLCAKICEHLTVNAIAMVPAR